MSLPDESGPRFQSTMVSEDLPPSSYDGTHLPWKAFRSHVLEPHHIRVVDVASKAHLPQELVSLIDLASRNTSRFDIQRSIFRDQVVDSKDGTPSPLFPLNLLPPIDDEPQLDRCMVPSFSREALPERDLKYMGPLYELSTPRPVLGCGFSAQALSPEDINVIPSFLVPTGTTAHFEKGHIPQSSALCCPFLLFERVWGAKESRREVAANLCAVGGAWIVRSLQLLYSQARMTGQLQAPVAFTCIVDNKQTILNLHWVDNDQIYSTASLCKFDLSKDDHFNHFLVWLECINQWALSYLLPQVKMALQHLRLNQSTPPATPSQHNLVTNAKCPTHDTLIRSLRTTFDQLPWQLDSATDVTSSTASWGSPMNNDLSLRNLHYPTIPSQRDYVRIMPTSMTKNVIPTLQHEQTPPPAYTLNTELVWQRRFNHAMDEIRDLQQQVCNMDDENTKIKTEMSSIKNTMTTILRKENFTSKSKLLYAGSVQETWQSLPPSSSLLMNKKYRPSCLNFETPLYSPVKEIMSDPSSPAKLSPGLISPLIFSPTPTVFSENVILIPPTPPTTTAPWKWATVMLSGHILGTMIPVTAVRIAVLGLITDICLLAFASPHYPSSVAWLYSLWTPPGH